MNLLSLHYKEEIRKFLLEDGLSLNHYFLSELPGHGVECTLFFKSSMLISGLPYFFSVFDCLQETSSDWSTLLKYEGIKITAQEHLGLKFNLPFNVAVLGERLALNLLQHSSGISTLTSKFVEKAKRHQIAILDTRKTTPGLRLLEKYAVRQAGAFNHRFQQTDVWIIKDNHKSFYGSLEKAYNSFKNIQSFYTPIIVEIHNLDELKQAISIGVQHVMLDNFSPEQVKQAINLKCPGMTFEVSGGINLDNIDHYLIRGVDAISVGAITNSAYHVDISLKYKMTSNQVVNNFLEKAPARSPQSGYELS